MLYVVQHGGIARSPKLMTSVEWDWGLDASVTEWQQIFCLAAPLRISSVRIAAR